MFFDIVLFIATGLFIRAILIFVGTPENRLCLIRDKINLLVFHFILPLICLKTTYSMPIRTEHLKISIVATMTIVSSAILAWSVYRLISKRVEISSQILGSLIICSSFGNVLYIGLPILTKLYGQQGTAYALTYDFLASTPLTWTLAVAISLKYGKAKGLRIKDSILTVAKIPPLWGLLIGILLREIAFEIPTFVVTIIDSIARYVSVLMLAVVGFSLKVVNPKGLIISIPAVFIKVLISPFLAFVYGKVLGLSGIPLYVCIIEAAMPSMLLSMLFATTFGLDLRTAVEMILLTTGMSLLITNLAIVLM